MFCRRKVKVEFSQYRHSFCADFLCVPFCYLNSWIFSQSFVRIRALNSLAITIINNKMVTIFTKWCWEKSEIDSKTAIKRHNLSTKKKKLEKALVNIMYAKSQRTNSSEREQQNAIPKVEVCICVTLLFKLFSFFCYRE